MQVAEVAGEVVEVGGSLYHKDNRLMARLVEEAGLEAFNPVHSAARGSEPVLLGVWDGEDVLFQESSSWLYSTVAGLWRYGYSAIAVAAEASSVLKQFLTIYPHLLDDEFVGFETVEGLLDAMGLRHLTTVSLREHLHANGLCSGWGDGRYCDEIVAGLTRVNYGQSLDLNALVGLIALIGSTGDVRAVRGGNYQAMEYAITAANAAFHRFSDVHGIRKVCVDEAHCTYSLLFRHAGEEHELHGLHAVVIAAPLEFADLAFEGFVARPGAHIKRDYQRTHVTFTVGDLNLKAYFGQDGDQPQAIITPETAAAEFTSCMLRSRYSSAGEKRALYKLFSRHPLEASTLDRIIANRTETFQTEFLAYPVLNPIREGLEFPPFVLDTGIFYVNALESAFSTIETEMMAGLNVAKLAAAFLDQMRHLSR